MLIQKALLPLVHSHSVSYGRFLRRLVDFFSIEFFYSVQYSMERPNDHLKPEPACAIFSTVACNATPAQHLCYVN